MITNLRSSLLSTNSPCQDHRKCKESSVENLHPNFGLFRNYGMFIFVKNSFPPAEIIKKVKGFKT